MAREMIVVHSVDDIPVFADEAEEAVFWDTHTFSEQLLAEVDDALDANTSPSTLARSKSITMRIEPGVLDRLRVVAGRKGIGYQTLTKTWLVERLRQEERSYVAEQSKLSPDFSSHAAPDITPARTWSVVKVSYSFNGRDLSQGVSLIQKHISAGTQTQRRSVAV